MAKETTQQKAERLLLAGKVTVTFVVGPVCFETEDYDGQSDWVRALVQGSDPKPYEVTGSSEGWTCSCVATVPYCSHRLAVMMVASLNPMGSLRKEDVPF